MLPQPPGDADAAVSERRAGICHARHSCRCRARSLHRRAGHAHLPDDVLRLQRRRPRGVPVRPGILRQHLHAHRRPDAGGAGAAYRFPRGRHGGAGGGVRPCGAGDRVPHPARARRRVRGGTAALRRLGQPVQPLVQEVRLARQMGGCHRPRQLRQGGDGQDAGHLLRVDRQPRRRRRRPAGHRRHRQEGRRAADRRQHAGDALPVPAQGVRRRHHRALAHQVPGRARQLDRRRHRRLRHLRLAQRQAQVRDAGRSQPQLQRHAAGRDLRQLRLRHRLPGAGPARPWAGDLALQRLPDPHGHRDAAAAHGEALRERGRGRQVSGQAQARSSG